MNPPNLLVAALLIGSALFTATTLAQDSTPPATTAEREAAYSLSIQKRADAILAELGLTDAAKSARVHEVITGQYRALRARDEVLDAKRKAGGKDGNIDLAGEARSRSKELHDRYIAKLGADLTPEQIEAVKDKMTYNKVKVTYDAYCAIVPGVTEPEKEKIMASLKDAREEAMDGGSAEAKSAVFQKYKDQINAYLTAQGHDVAKAYKEWDAKQLTEKQKLDAAGKPPSAAAR